MSQNQIDNETQPVGLAAPGSPELADPNLGTGTIHEPGSSRSPLREMLLIAAPSVATMASYTVMQFADKLTVSRIGPEPIYVAAQGNAGIVTWTLMTFSVGVSGVVSSFVSQNLGAGKPERGAAYAWNGMWLGALWWMLIMVPAAFVVPRLYGLTGHAPEVVTMESAYAQVAMAGAIFTLASKAMHNYFFGMHKPGVVMVSVITANAVNILASIAFVFGPEMMPLGEGGVDSVLRFAAVPAAWIAQTLHIPAMGLVGSAWGTVLGTSIELLIPLAIFLGPRQNALYHTRRAWRLSKGCLKGLAKIGWPAGTVFINELVCWAYLTVVLLGMGGRAKAVHEGLGPDQVVEAGTVATTAGYIALQFMHLGFMPSVGLAIATQAMVGRAMGAGDPDRARAHAILGLKLAMGYMCFCTLAFILLRHQMIRTFLPAGASPEEMAQVVAVGSGVLIVAAIFQVFDAIGLILSAALRGAGDTVWPGVVGVTLSWLCVVGLGWVMVEVTPQFGSIGPWVGACTYIILMSLAMAWRFSSGKWRSMKLAHSDDLHDLPPDPVATGQAEEAV